MISVIIPTHNRAEGVCDCINSVLESASLYGGETEVVVVDDCSTDNTRELIASRYARDARVKYCCNEKKQLPSTTRNRGRRESKGELLFFLDDDNIIYPECLTELVKGFHECPTAGAIAPAIVFPDKEGSLRTIATYCDFNHWTGRPQDRGFNAKIDELSARQTLLPTTCYSNAYMTPSAVFDACGGFDEVLGYVFEEIDYCWRVDRLGHPCFISTRGRTNHLVIVAREDNKQLRCLRFESKHRAYCLGRNRYIFARRYYTLLQNAVIILLTPFFMAYYMRLAIGNKRWDLCWAYAKGTLVGMFGCY